MLAMLVVVTVAASLIGTGLTVAGVFFPSFIVRDAENTRAVRVFALYAVARSVPLLLVILWAAFRADPSALIWLGALSGAIQLSDAAVGTQTGKQIAIWGPLGVSVVQLATVLLAVLFGIGDPVSLA
jgi:hypothetical protein